MFQASQVSQCSEQDHRLSTMTKPFESDTYQDRASKTTLISLEIRGLFSKLSSKNFSLPFLSFS